MNVPEIDLGETLNVFKAETSTLKPPYRGKRLGSNAFIRNIHNSFARYGLGILSTYYDEANDGCNSRMDILNADLALYNDMQKWERSRKYKRKRAAKKKYDDENEAGFHFVAYVPIDGEVWKLDGLRRQPGNLGILLALTMSRKIWC
jgi:ubiquitin carboxyl-terminal hydrolase L5